MKISGAYIDGFGVFHDQSISDVDKGLVLFCGHNEAGKSTLLGFIRSVLFGFPRANSRNPAYLPVSGGVHGGRLDFLTAAGETWSVSRKPGKGGGAVTLTGPDGRIHDKTRLDSLLGGVSYEAFRSIMAFGLSELQTMDTLSGEHITSAIYGAGLGTSMNAMPRALKQIRKRMDDLFKNRASTKTINRIAGELDQIRKALHEAALQAGRYDAIIDALSEADKNVEALREKVSDRRRERQQYETLERMRDDWITYAEKRHALAELGPLPETFPEDGLASLETLVEKREQFENTIRELKARHGQLSLRLSHLPVEEKVLDQASDIAFLVENRNAYQENGSNLPTTTRDADELDNKVNRLLSHLGNGWTETAVLDFDRSLFTRETIRGHQEALGSLEKKFIATETLRKDKNTAVNQAADICRTAEKDLAKAGDMPPRRNPETIRRLRQGRDRTFDALAERHQLSGALSKAHDELHRLQQASSGKGTDKKWPAIVIALMGTIAAGTFAWFGKWNEAAMTLLAALLATWAALVYRRQQQQIRINHQELVRRQQLRVEELSTRVRHLESIQTDYSKLAADAGAATSVDEEGEALLETVDRFFSILSEEDSRRDAVTQAQRRLEEKSAIEAASQEVLEKTLEELDALEKQRDETKAAWAETCRRLGLSHTLSPATALEALDVVDETLKTLEKRDRMRAETLRLGSELSKYREAAHQVLSDVSWPDADDDDLPHIVTELVARLEESRGNQREKDALGRQMSDIERERTALTKDLSEIKESVDCLLETAGIPEEASFRKIGRMQRERRDLTTAVRSAEGNMRRISGEINTTALQDLLETLSKDDVITRKEAADEEARRMDAELSDLYTRRAELKQTLDTLSTSEDIDRLRAREAAFLSDLADHARDWSRHAVAEHLILQARNIYERRHQPEIIQDAGDIFSRMTDGKYQGVVSPLGENTIIAVDQKGNRIPPEHLSRGTAEQLYLSVRFSYIRHQAKKSDPLPVIMDDILVNFDPVRARKAAGAIRDLSETHQVLMFTCHPETVDVFQEIGSGLPVFTLDGGRIFSPNPSLTSKKS